MRHIDSPIPDNWHKYKNDKAFKNVGQVILADPKYVRFMVRAGYTYLDKEAHEYMTACVSDLETRQKELRDENLFAYLGHGY